MDSSSAWRSRGIDLRGDVLGSEAQTGQHPGLVVGAGGGVGADGARDGTDADLLEGALQAEEVPVCLEGEAGEPQAEARRLRVDTVGPADGEGGDLLAGPGRERVHQLPRAREDRLAGLLELQPEGSVEDVRGGQPEVDPPSALACGGTEHVDEGGHVVVGDPLALVDGLDGEGGGADGLELGLGGALGGEQERQLLGGGDLHLPPGLHPGLVGPQTA